MKEKYLNIDFPNKNSSFFSIMLAILVTILSVFTMIYFFGDTLFNKRIHYNLKALRDWLLENDINDALFINANNEYLDVTWEFSNGHISIVEFDTHKGEKRFIISGYDTSGNIYSTPYNSISHQNKTLHNEVVKLLLKKYEEYIAI